MANKYPMPKSKSSHALIKLLTSSVDEKKIRSQEESHIKNRKITSATKYLKSKGITPPSPSSARFDVDFSPEELEEIAQKTKDTLVKEKLANTKNKQDGLVNFFTKSCNTGKKMQRVIMEVTLGKV